VLRQTVRGKLNMEMSLAEEIVAIARDLRPDQATLVPEGRQEVTTEGGLDVVAGARRVAEVAGALREAGVVVSAFVEAEPEQIRAARKAGCDAVELHTGRYANAWLLRDARGRGGEVRRALEGLRDGLKAGLDEGLVVHAGHGLTYANVSAVAAMAGFGEFNIGHSIISHAVFVGLRQAVAEMKRLITEASGR